MGLIITPPACTVSIGGVPCPLAQVSGLTEALAPEVDSCTITVPWGSRKISGAADPAEDLPALGATVVVTMGTITWRGLVTRRSRVASGMRRGLRLAVHGPGLVLDRSYLPSFARFGLLGAVTQAAGGPRFAPGTRSTSATGPGGTYILGGSADWTVGQALAAYLAHATYAGLPAITLVAGSADLSRVLPDLDTDGLSFHAALQEILGHRLGVVWRCVITASGWELRLTRLRNVAGAQIDLTGGDVVDYEVGEDASATLASLEVRGSRTQYVFSADCYVGGSGDIRKDWTGADETARADGDSGSPAFRRFKVNTFALPDGSASVLAEAIPTLPVADNTVLTEGSSAWLLFAQDSYTANWISLQGRVSVSVSGLEVWVEGIQPDEWVSWSRVRFTCCMSPRAHLQTVKTGGSGLGRGLAVIAARHAVASSAAVRAHAGGTLDSVSGIVRSGQMPIDGQADDLWDSLRDAQLTASWTRVGVAGGDPDPGARISGISLPVPGGIADAVYAPGTGFGICLSRSVSCGSDGVPRTTWQVGVPSPSVGALSR